MTRWEENQALGKASYQDSPRFLIPDHCLSLTCHFDDKRGRWSKAWQATKSNVKIVNFFQNDFCRQ